MKNILYITYDGLTDPLGQSQVLPYVIGLCKKGYNFTLLSFEKEANYKLLATKIQGICDANSITWKPIKFHTKPPILAKMYDRWIMKKTATEICMANNIAMIHCRSYLSAEVALDIKKKLSTPFLFDMRGFWADEKVDSGHWDQSRFVFKRVYRHYKNLERQFIAHAGHIVSLTHAGKKELQRIYGSQTPHLDEKIAVIPTCADFSLFNYNNITNTQLQQLANKLGIAGRYVITYSGSVGGWYMINEMLEFFKVFKTYVPNAVFLCLTKEPAALVNAHVQQHQINPADVVTAFANRDELPLYLGLSNAAVFFIKNTYSKLSSSPTKYPEIMGLGVAVICNDIGDTGKIVNETASGVLVTGFDIPAYQKACETFLSHSFNKADIRQRAIENFDLDIAITKYLGIYRKVLG